MEDMVHILGYNSEAGPREIMKIRTDGGDSGWLIRFFDSAFFCEWIAISYLYKYEHQGVRDYLCNRMYALPDAGIEAYLAQLCYMLVHRSSPGLDRYVVDMCAKSLRIALKVHWFLLAELEEGSGDSDELSRLQERCQMSAQRGNWPPLVQPKKVESSPSPSSKSRMFKHFLSSKGLLNLTSSPSPPPKPSSSPVSPMPAYIDQEPKTLAEESELPSNVFKKLMPGTKVRDALVKKFSTKEDGGNVEQAKENEAQPRENEADSFFHRFLRNKDVDDDSDDDDKAGHSEELVRSESLFRRLFPEKVDNDEKLMSKATEEDSFFRRLLFRDKADDKDNAESNHRDHEHEKGNACLEEEEVSDFSLFRRFFRVHPESKERPAVSITEGSAPNSENAPANESFLKKFFREHSSEDSNSPNLRKEDSFSPSNFLMKLKLFKDRTDESAVPVSDSVGENNRLQDAPLAMDANGFHESARLQHTDDCDDTLNETLTPRRKTKDTGFQMDVSSKNSYAGGSGATRMTFSKSVASGSSSLLVTSTSAPTSFLIKLPGSPKRTTEKIVSKPPLPKVSSSQLRKGAYHATLDFIRSLCEISTGLVDVFPMEDRWKSLHESLVELNGLLKSAQNDGGVCFPMGTGLYRIVHISEDEYTLLNSRERAPYSICLEVLQCDEQSPVRETKEAGSQKLSRGGIPLANGDVQLQRPPPWAYPVWNPSHAQRSSTNNTLRAASKAIDDAMNNIWDVKSKFVHVSLSVAQRCIDGAQDQTNEPDDHHPVVVDRDPLQTDSEDCGRELRSLNSSTFICTDLFQFGEGGSIGTDDNLRERDAQSGEAGSFLRLKESQNGFNLPSDEWVSVILTVVPGLNMDDMDDKVTAKKKDHRRVPSTVAMAEVKAAAAKGESPLGLPVHKGGAEVMQAQLEDISGKDAKATDALASELWDSKKNRMQKLSKYGNLSGWDLRCVIVKSGDDCRQEHLAVQLISHFYDIFQEAGLPLWLRPYEILVASSRTALIEMIPDTASIHSIKSRNPNVSSLRDFFCKKYEEDSPNFKLAQRNFVESMAAYSILCYILQVKDRHNGNLLLDEEGHVIHIDFGFMLSNSPGGVNFESAPFKLTRELLEVMDSDAEGTSSEFFDYFKVLCIQGFLICRKHAERIILLVEMMQDSGYPCFKAGSKTIQNLWKRFHLTLTEEQCVSLVLSLISSSLDAWRTRQYDYYQRVLNGIL